MCVSRIQSGYILVETERKSKKSSKNETGSTKTTAKSNPNTKTVDESKYRDYFDFSVPKHHIKPHQVKLFSIMCRFHKYIYHLRY